MNNVHPEIQSLIDNNLDVDEGSSFNQSFSLSSTTTGSYTWSLVSNPYDGWLDICAETGVLSGTPGWGDASNSQTISVKVVDNNGGYDEISFNLTVGANVHPEIQSLIDNNLDVDEGGSFNQSFSLSSTTTGSYTHGRWFPILMMVG